MEKKEINQREALRLIRSGEAISEYTVVLDTEKIEVTDAILLGSNNISIPKGLVWYNDDVTDFSDDADICKEDFETGKLSWMINTSLPLEPEIKQWIKREKIDVDKLLTQLVKNFYETVKSVNKNVAM